MAIVTTPPGYAAPVVTWESVAIELALYVPACPEFELEDKLKERVREFFRDSNCWRSRDVSLGLTVYGQRSYPVTAPVGAALNKVHAAWLGTEEIDVMLPGEDDDVRPGTIGTPERIGVEAGACFLSPAPSAGGRQLKASLSWQPLASSVGFLASVYDEHRMGILHGVAGALKLQPGKPWSDPASYPGYERLFQASITEAAFVAGPVRRFALRTSSAGI